MYKICLLPGDGIGPEVIGQAERVLRNLPLQLEIIKGEIGYEAYQRLGTPLPEETLEKVRQADATLFGAVTTPPNLPNYFSAIIRLRQTFNLYANLRPCRSFEHSSSKPNINLLVVRENTEGLYSGIERVEDNGNRAITERVITRAASEKILNRAFQLARERNFKKVTVVHKANVLRETDGLFRKIALEVAELYSDIQMEEMLVDTCAMELIRIPEQFEVIVTTNLFGDILSDEASMLVGGIGVAASGNIGEETAIFEPVHGSAPTLAKNVANPTATFLAMVMMLEYLGEVELAAKLDSAVRKAIAANQVTVDMGGEIGTEEMTDWVIEVLNND